MPAGGMAIRVEKSTVSKNLALILLVPLISAASANE